jgi:cytochrome c2
VQPEYDPVRTALAFPVGAALGGAIHGAGEVMGAAARGIRNARRAGGAAEARPSAPEPIAPAEAERAALAEEDPALKTPEMPTPSEAVVETPTEPADAPEAPKAPEEAAGEPEAVPPVAPEAAAPAIEEPAAAAEREAAALRGEPISTMAPHRVATADGKSIDVTPIVTEARDLKTSADEGYDPSLQPRDRDRDRAAAQQQVRTIAGSLDPERLGLSAEADRGAPIIGPDGMVESGNGRVMAIRQAYAEGDEAAQRYRDWLATQGVDVARYDEPVLVRQRTTALAPEERQAFAIAANRPATLALSAPERALADARAITPDMLELIRNPDDLGAVANRDFVRSFVDKLPQAEQGTMATAEGGLSSEGLARVRNAVLARAYSGDEAGAALPARIAEATHDEVRSISNALVSAAPLWARMRADIEAGRVRGDVDLTHELLEAVQRTADLRAKGIKLADHLAQQDAFHRLSPAVEEWMRMFYDPAGRRAAGAARIAEGLKKTYAIEARKVSAEQGLDLGLAPTSAADIQRLAIERSRGGSDQSGILLRGGAGDGANAAAGGGEIRRSGIGGEGPSAGDAGAGRARPGEGESRSAGTPSDLREGARRSTPLPAAGTGEDPVRSLQQQAFDLAESLDLPLRQGRIRNPRALGQYDTRQDVARVRAVADFETVAHEAGHAVEKKIGPELTDLTKRFAGELAPLDYDPAKGRVFEGFAEWMRFYLTAPAHAQNVAPGFAAAFQKLMRDKAPEMLAALDRGRDAYQAWVNARSDVRIEAMVVRREPESIIERIRADGLPRTISLWLGRAYEALMDDKAPAARVFRDIARAARDASGMRLKLEGADNPEVLMRMFGRAQQAGVRDMLDGVRPYHGIEPEGPSLRDALIHATGEPGIFGRWDDEKLKAFSNYLVARRGAVLWDKYDTGLLPNRPIAMSKADIADAIARFEAEHPTFGDGSDMVHQFTRQLLRKQFEGGLIDRELYDKLMQEPFYVPLYRDMSDKPLAAGQPTSGAARSQGPGMADLIKRQQGSDRDVVDPIQSLMTQAFLVNRTLAHNDIIKAWVGLARQATKAGASGVGRFIEEILPSAVVGKRFDLAETVAAAARQHGIDETDTKVLLGAVSDIFGDDPIMATIFRREPTKPQGEPIIFYKDGGQLRAVRLISQAEGESLYEAVATMPTEMRDWAINAMAASATMLRVGVTTNPTFFVSNYLRDQVAASILMPGYIPFNPRGIIRALGQDRWAQLYTHAGGVSPGAGAAGLGELIDGSIEELARKGWAVKQLGGVVDLVTRGDIVAGAKAFGETVELAETGTRLNVFKRVFEQKQRQGLSDYDAMLEAAHQSTDLMDFGRHGSSTLMIRRLIPFLNAHMQGLDKARRTLFEPLSRAARGDLVTEADVTALKNAGAAWGLVGVSGALGFAYGAYNSGHDAYRDANPDLRATHLIIPGGAFDMPGEIVLVPKPFELSIGFNLGEMAGLAATTGDPRIARFIMAGLQEVVMPPNVMNSIPVVKTYAELALNRSFYTGNDIVPDRLQRLMPAEQYTEHTSSLAKLVGGAIGVSPVKVDYAIGASFGNWGRDLLAASNTADPNAPAAAFDNTMFLRRFIKGADAASDTTQQFWKLAAAQNGQYAQAKNTYENMLGQFRDKDAAAFLGALPSPERAYVTLQSAAGDNGKPAFNGDDKRLHPLTRAATAVMAINGYVRELTQNAQHAVETGERADMDPQKRRQAIDNLRVLAAMEQRNALVIAGEPGYRGRTLLSTEDQLATLRAVAPTVADEIASFPPVRAALRWAG